MDRPLDERDIEDAQDDTTRWTNSLRETILRESERDLLLFAKGFAGYSRLTVESHGDLCDKLDGRGDWGPDWNRAVIAAFRGWFKTSIIRAWALQRAIFRINHSIRYFGGSYDNAKDAFMRPLQKLFQESEGAEFRQWLLSPSERFPAGRIPRNFEGWLEDQIRFTTTDANAQASISIRGVGSKPEGYHGNDILIDDPEGVEAEKGGVHQIDALRFISSATPLLINPKKGCIVLIGTSHGADPAIYRALHEDFNLEGRIPQGQPNWNNAEREWKAFWQPVYKSDGSAAFPVDGEGEQRFDLAAIKTIRRSMSSQDFNQQYLLLRGAQAGSWWSRKTVESNFAQWEKPNLVLSYPFVRVNMRKWRETGELESKIEKHRVRTDEMFYYAHFDPKHKKHTTSYQRSKVRPSRAAIIVTGTTPDGHVIVMDYWLKQEADVEEQLEKLREFHIRYGLRKFSSDPVGAQSWVGGFLNMLETKNKLWGSVYGKSLWGEVRTLPRLSNLIVPDQRTPKMSKEEIIHARLDGMMGSEEGGGTLHFLEGQVDLINEIVGLPDGSEFVDGADALAQGGMKDFWQFPSGHKVHEALRQSQAMLRNMGLRFTHYKSPLHKGPPVKGIIKPDWGDPAATGFPKGLG